MKTKKGKGDNLTNSNYSQALPMAHKCARENIFQNKLGVPQTFLNMTMTEMHRHHKEMHQ